MRTLLITLSCILLAGTSLYGGTDWYEFSWMKEGRHIPKFAVLDTQSSLGPYAGQVKEITLTDLVKFHGHPCDGLFIAAHGLSLAFGKLFPDGVIDRTDAYCITNNSPCFGDVAAYLSGGRIRFGSQKIRKELKQTFIIYRPSTKQAVEVSLKKGVFPVSLKMLENKIKAGRHKQEDIKKCQRLQWEFAKSLLAKPANESFSVKVMDNFVWQADKYEHVGKRGDVLLKGKKELKGIGKVRIEYCDG